MDTEELEAADPVHWCPVDADGALFSILSLEVHHNLLGLADVEGEVMLLAPEHTLFHRSSVISRTTVVSSAKR